MHPKQIQNQGTIVPKQIQKSETIVFDKNKDNKPKINNFITVYKSEVNQAKFEEINKETQDKKNENTQNKFITKYLKVNYTNDIKVENKILKDYLFYRQKIKLLLTDKLIEKEKEVFNGDVSVEKEKLKNDIQKIIDDIKGYYDFFGLIKDKSSFSDKLYGTAYLYRSNKSLFDPNYYKNNKNNINTVVDLILTNLKNKKNKKNKK